MTQVNHGFVERTTTGTVSPGDTSWHDLLVLGDGDFSFTGSKKYLIVCKADFAGDQSYANIAMRLTDGYGSVYPGSECVAERGYTHSDTHHSYMWFHVWTCPPLPLKKQKLQYKALNSSYDVRLSYASILAIELTELTEDTDWGFDQDSNNTTLSTAWSTSNNALLDIDPTNDDDVYLILSTAQIIDVDTSVNTQSRLHLGDTTEFAAPALIGISQEGEDATYDKHVQTHIWAGKLKAGETIPIRQESKKDSSTGSQKRAASALFYLNLSKFETADFSFTLSAVNLGTTLYGTKLGSLVFSSTVNSPLFVLAAWVADVNSMYRKVASRLQEAQSGSWVDNPSGQTAAAIKFNGWDSTDRVGVFHMALSSTDTDLRRQLKMDGSVNSTSSTPQAEERLVVAWTAELKSTPPSTTASTFSSTSASTTQTKSTTASTTQTQPPHYTDAPPDPTTATTFTSTSASTTQTQPPHYTDAPPDPTTATTFTSTSASTTQTQPPHYTD